jgi:hypothetical protein
LTAEPSTGAIAVGIAIHQWPGFSWALVFFGVFGKWTANRGPAWLAGAAVPWAILTSSLEWFVLVPLFPFWQPIFTLQQPYWIGFLVHLSSPRWQPREPATRTCGRFRSSWWRAKGGRPGSSLTLVGELVR